MGELERVLSDLAAAKESHNAFLEAWYVIPSHALDAAISEASIAVEELTADARRIIAENTGVSWDMIERAGL